MNNTEFVYTVEHINAYYAAYGYGCKACGKTHDKQWWTTAGDVYCTSCKKYMWNANRTRFTAIPTCAQAGRELPTPIAHDPTNVGWQLAAEASVHADEMAPTKKTTDKDFNAGAIATELRTMTRSAQGRARLAGLTVKQLAAVAAAADISSRPRNKAEVIDDIVNYTIIFPGQLRRAMAG